MEFKKKNFDGIWHGFKNFEMFLGCASGFMLCRFN